ncbi:MAG TPA: uroporphyrinogen decarboxylase family protein [Atribacteraceae bacterium]|nr:uroporphyrinogen decarboxylase family protein [Atribacteraceae bacterium]
MTPRERFRAICRFERVDDPYFWGVDSWTEAFRRWIREGMPVKNLQNKKELNHHLLGYQSQNEAIWPNAAVRGMSPCNNPPWVPPLDPLFEVKVIKEEESHIVKVDYDGAVVRVMKNDPEKMPQYLAYPVKDQESWETYKKRLNPHSPGRWPEGWDTITDGQLQWPIREGQAGKSWEERDFPLGMMALSLFGMPRNYMGLEHISLAIYDNPSLVEAMVEWQCHFSFEMLKKVFASGVTLDWVWLWEDMCYNKGSLVSPSFVKRVMVPRYRKVVDLLLENGVTALILDSDGNTEELIPIWLDCGINAQYPFEIASNMDPVRLRKQYGKNLIIVGGVDKRMLAQSKTDIDREVEKVKFLTARSGYFVNCDHHIPPDVPYDHLRYFLNQVHALHADSGLRRKI